MGGTASEEGGKQERMGGTGGKGRTTLTIREMGACMKWLAGSVWGAETWPCSGH